MLTVLDRWEHAQLGLRMAVGELERVTESLHGVADHDYLQELRQWVGTMEIVNATMLDEGRTSPSDSEQEALTDAAMQLRLILEPY